MPSVLLIGYDPADLPNSEDVLTRLEKEATRFAEHSIDVTMTMVMPNDSAESAVLGSLAEGPWDVIIVGGGLRTKAELLPLFEQVVNLIRRHSPQVAVAFNESIESSVETAKRWLP
ncbi:hypothetical protein [Streptacidiphilus sp. P02-A3a]|uniref:hypothetical protein n=1 Tax=Streptacidiphilus sp. P02-A3a TaxID=2704468 RepID=UPI0015FA1B71|nr:hypothetical protein [Streptacidiphilus sp. P02-A3a]QMU70872.1 hypothetical protein GXP74_24290 [Streptacidiphilus sp. P02-A3a]